MDEIKKYDKLAHIETNPRNTRIDFDEFPTIQIKVKEIYNCEITGTFTKTTGKFRGNIVMSSLNGFKTDNADLKNVDWKDSNFRDCLFNNTSLDICAVINCHFSTSKFNKCSFDDMAITGSVFYEIEFNDCDLSNIVIESCRFFKCSFNNCKSSNKIFEHCLLFDCSFNNTDIQLQTIIENFGLEIEQIINCNIRNASIDEVFKFLGESDLQKLYSFDSSLHNFYKFKIEYFLHPEITIDGSELFDKIFKIDEWIPLCKAQTTFINMFKSFHDFFIILFEQNKTLLIVIYKLKGLTSWISNQDVIKSNFELYPIIMGYDIGLTRIISQAYLIIKNTIEKLNGKMKLLVAGPLNKKFYYDSIGKCINGDFKITKLEKQNSPNILEITAVSSVIVQVVALFVVTRVKLEFANRKEKNKTKKRKRKYSRETDPDINPYQLSKFERKSDNEDFLQLYFSKSLNYNINYFEYKSLEVGKVRKIIIEIYDNFS